MTQNNDAKVNFDRVKANLKEGLIKQKENIPNLRETNNKVPDQKKSGPLKSADPSKRKPSTATIFSSAKSNDRSKLDAFKKRRGQ